MKLPILDEKKAKTGELALPAQFREPVRDDLIRRAVHALQAAARQPYGADPDAGKRSSAKLSRRRRNYRGSYGQGISRVPRKVLNRRGTRMYYVGAFAPGTVGGRRAHPPKAGKEWAQKVNKKENRKAIRSALAAVMDASLVTKRGHKLPDHYPFLIDDSFERLTRTKHVEQALVALGFADELARALPTTLRAGKAKMRGRKTRRATSLLLVTGDADASLLRAAQNVAGVDAVPVGSLNAELLAPGTHPGRATLFTRNAVAMMAERRLFLEQGASDEAVPGVAPKQTSRTPAKSAASPSAASKHGAASKNGAKNETATPRRATIRAQKGGDPS